jgi:hypothetical protein
MLGLADAAAAGTLTVNPSNDLPRRGRDVIARYQPAGGELGSYVFVTVARGPGYVYCRPSIPERKPASGAASSGFYVSSVLTSINQDPVCAQPDMPPNVVCATDAQRSCTIEVRGVPGGEVRAAEPITFLPSPVPDTSILPYDPQKGYIEVRSPQSEIDRVAFECSLDGGPFALCGPEIPGNYSRVYPTYDVPFGTHTLVSRAVSELGDRDPSPASLSLSIATSPGARFLTQFGTRLVSGTVLVRRPGDSARTKLAGEQAMPVGSEFDARRGRVGLSVAPGGPLEKNIYWRQAGDLFGGQFTAIQSAANRPVDLRMSGPLTGCAKGGTRTIRRLAADSQMQFRVLGRKATATSATPWTPTRWLVQDRCDGSTRVSVTAGQVDVKDLRLRKTHRLKAGQSYVARAKRR